MSLPKIGLFRFSGHCVHMLGFVFALVAIGLGGCSASSGNSGWSGVSAFSGVVKGGKVTDKGLYTGHIDAESLLSKRLLGCRDFMEGSVSFVYVKGRASFGDYIIVDGSSYYKLMVVPAGDRLYLLGNSATLDEFNGDELASMALVRKSGPRNNPTGQQ